MCHYRRGSALTLYNNPIRKIYYNTAWFLNIQKGAFSKILVSKNYILDSTINNLGFALVGCIVSPNFGFNDFELFERNYLLNKYS